MNFFSLEGFSRKTIAGLFLIKLFAGIVLALIYTYYYPYRQAADIYKYYDAGEAIYNTLLKNPSLYFQIIFGINSEDPQIKEVLETANHWYKPSESVFYNDSRTIMRFNAIVRIVSFGSIGVHTAVMCFLSFIGLTALYKTCLRFMHDKKKELLFAIYLIPSVVFWGSGLIKESMVLFVMGCFIYFCFQLIHGHINPKNILGFLFFTIFFLLSKIYVLLALLPALLAYFICERFKSGNTMLKHGLLYLLLLTFTLNIHLAIPNYNILEIISNKQSEFLLLAKHNEAGSLYQIPTIEPNALSFISGFPLAVFNVLLRPLFFDMSTPIVFLAIMENIVIMLIIGFCLLFFKRKTEHLNFMLFCIGFVVLLFGIIGMTTPVLGAVVRYKIPGLPLLMIIFLFYYNKDRAINKFPILKFLKS
ncbi:MAG TPA: hypothetical protein EYM84_07460 [Flavobacteriales bacterium]|nr:hypothetical protein [Flavobacteriales bacterium]